MKKILLFCFFLGIFGCETYHPLPPVIDQNVTQRLLELHNYQRELKARPKLQLDPRLMQYAQEWASTMAKQNNLYHSRLSFMREGIYFTGGENIAWNQRSADEVTRSWMNSMGHRENILNRNFTKVGFAVVYNSRNEPYWCTVFAG